MEYPLACLQCTNLGDDALLAQFRHQQVEAAQPQIAGKDASDLFSLSLMPGNGVFGNFFGLLDGLGQAQASIALPALPVLVGLPLHVSGFVLPSLGGLAVDVMLPWARTVGR